MRAPQLALAMALLALGCARSAYDSQWIENSLAARSARRVRHVEDAADPLDFVASLPPGVNSTTATSEGDAIAIALWNSTQFQSELAQVGLARADLLAAGAIPNPVVSFLLPISTRQAEISASYPLAWILQRPSRVAAAKAEVERVARNLLQTGLDLIRDVRIAHAELVFAERRQRLLDEARDISAGSAKVADARLSRGDATRIEVDALQADALTASDLAERAAHDETIAREKLRLLLGLGTSDLGAHLSAAFDPPRLTAPPDLSGAERLALASRPDLQAARLALEAAGDKAGIERAKIAQFGARLDAKPIGSRGAGPTLWLPGAQIDVPIFDQNQAGRARASAELRRAAFLFLTKKQEVATDVRVSHAEVRVALQSIEPWTREIVPRVSKNLEATTKAYEAGGEPYLAVLDASRRLVDARIKELNLDLDLRRARARFDRAVGWRIDVRE